MSSFTCKKCRHFSVSNPDDLCLSCITRQDSEDYHKAKIEPGDDIIRLTKEIRRLRDCILAAQQEINKATVKLREAITSTELGSY